MTIYQIDQRFLEYREVCTTFTNFQELESMSPHIHNMRWNCSGLIYDMNKYLNSALNEP